MGVGGWQDAADRLVRSALAPLGRALSDHRGGERGRSLLVRVAGEPPERLETSYFFRPPSRMGLVDRTALELARGRVLDVGACAGAHSLPLHRRGLPVTSLELVPEAVAVLTGRGLPDVREESVWSFRSDLPYDTVLALMNGAALAGTLARLEPLLHRIRELTRKDGQLLVDSTEVDAEEGGDLFGEGESGGALELHYQLEYRGERGPPFPQLMVSSSALESAAARAGWRTEVVARHGGRYLARLRPAPPGRRRTRSPGLGSRRA